MPAQPHDPPATERSLPATAALEAGRIEEADRRLAALQQRCPPSEQTYRCLRLADERNLDIAIYVERIEEASAQVAQARVLAVPTLRAGARYDRHTGAIQETGGQVLDVDRVSRFIAHFSTAIEMLVPLALLFSHGGWPTAIAAFVMLCFHFGILSAIPMGVPLEWNVFMMFSVVALFVGYAWFTRALVGDIRRVFAYHGAEHQTIAAWEHGEELDPEQVGYHSTKHVRCGTNFLIMVMLIAILVYSIAGSLLPAPGEGIVAGVAFHVLLRVALLPLVAGLAYEGLRLGAGRDNWLVRALMKPGLWLQHITTKPSEPEMVEVAIRAFEAVAPADQTAGRLPSDLPSAVVWGPDDRRDTGEQLAADAGGQPPADDGAGRPVIADPAEEPTGGA